MQISQLVLSGGGTRGLVLLGSLHHLFTNNMLNMKYIHSVYGVSIGGIIGGMLTFGFTPLELFDFMNQIDIGNIIGGTVRINQILECKSIYPQARQKLTFLIESLMKYKNIPLNITMYEHYKLTGKKLNILLANITTKRHEMFNYQTHPNVSLVTVLYATAAVPFIFPFVTINGNTYVDGAICDHIPIEQAINNECYYDRTIGISLNDMGMTTTYSTNAVINDLIKHIHGVYNTSQDHQYTVVNMYKDRLIHLVYTDLPALALNSVNNIKQNMFDFGVNETIKQSHKIPRIVNSNNHYITNAVNHSRVINELKQKFITQVFNDS